MKKWKTAAVLILWAVLAALAWFMPARAESEAERRPLAQRPRFSAKSVLSGEFMEDFEDFSLDQFPLRDGFRSLKAVFHSGVLGQKDNNGIYLAEGYAAAQEYPLNEKSVRHALARFQFVRETYLADSKIYMAVVPDKGYYLAEKSGHLSMDYERLSAMCREGMPWAAHVDLTGDLALDSYYRTDTHWRQERLLAAAETLCDALGVTPPKAEDFSKTELERPFYGVYYGQAALPMEPDTICLMESEQLKNCRVYDYETEEYAPVYDKIKLEGKDPYDVFLSGAKSLLTIENPGGDRSRELIVFRDSFGSSMAPLLVGDYGKVTLVDIRYIRPELLGRYLDFHGQDVLFLYSTLVLNNSAAIR